MTVAPSSGVSIEKHKLDSAEEIYRVAAINALFAASIVRAAERTKDGSMLFRPSLQRCDRAGGVYRRPLHRSARPQVCTGHSCCLSLRRHPIQGVAASEAGPPPDLRA